MDSSEVCQGHWPSGQLQFQYTLINGIQQGLSQKWHENGVLYEIINFRDGRPYGEFWRFHEDGTIAGHGFMLGENKFHGVYDMYAVNHWNRRPYTVRQIFKDGIQLDIFSVNVG